MFGAYERVLRTITHGRSEGVKLRIFAKKASDVSVLTHEEFKHGQKRPSEHRSVQRTFVWHLAM